MEFNSLYILGKSMFYLAVYKNQGEALKEAALNQENINIVFKDKSESFTTVCSAEVLNKSHEEFADASEFFTGDITKIDYILELTIQEIK